jgi:hypothetical protein
MRLAVSGSSVGVLIELEGVWASVPCRVASVVLHVAGEAARFVAAAGKGWVSTHPLSALNGPQPFAPRHPRAGLEIDVPAGSVIHIIADDGDITEIV